MGAWIGRLWHSLAASVAVADWLASWTCVCGWSSAAQGRVERFLARINWPGARWSFF
jgi:hypothetical protein